MMLNVLRRVGLFLVILCCGGTASASELSDDLTAKRARLMARLPVDAMLVLFSAPPRVYSNDVDYEYHQDSNLYYLTALAQEQTALVLMPGNVSKREILFIKDRNPEREHWNGRVLTRDEARERTGVATVLSISDFDRFIGNMLSGSAHGATIDKKEAATYFAALGEGHAKVALAVENGEAGVADASPARAFLQRIRDQYVGFVPINATPHLVALRMVKTPYELTLLTAATDVSAEGQIAGMRTARPGAFEYEVKAAIEAVHRSRGAVSWAYPSIVGSGPNATILHYPESDRQMKAGDLLLVDAAANVGYQASDLTRTYPVSGTFTKPQQDIYELVLHAHEEAVKAAVPGSTLTSIHDRTVAVLKEGLQKLGLITDTSGSQYRMWFTHSTSHYVGLDVHDVGTSVEPLQPGMTFTIEPGLYIRKAVLEQLPQTSENRALVEAIKGAVDTYDGIGVRIEDTYVMETGVARTLSPHLPRTIKDVEAAMRGPRSSSSGGR